TKRYGGTAAVDAASFDIEEKSITGLLGRNGAGKTTVMSLLTGQTFPTSGTVSVLGENPLENDRILTQMCFMRENQRYANNVKVHHVLRSASYFYQGWDDKLAESLVDDFGLPRGRKVIRLSRGMKSALGIVVAMAARAPVTIFDEPYLGLDATARQLFYDRLIEDYTEHPRTLVLSTHLIDEIGQLLDSVLVIDNGRIVVDAAAEDLRGSATTLSGSTARVEELARELIVISRAGIGSLASVTVAGPLTAEQRRRAAATSVELQAVPLQRLVQLASQSHQSRPGITADPVDTSTLAGGHR
ncbi:MAG: ABC transporter ATP-binding protein, partial [Nocardioidaceae bacterium]